MIPIKHPWDEWQEDTEELYGWKWKKDTPKEIKELYNEWKEYYDKKMKYDIT